MVKKIFLLLVFLCFLTVLAGGGALYWFIVLHPGEEIQPENINSILGKESPVFYKDGVTRLGVFFDQAHRQYVPYEEIPVNFINALVASEDNHFFTHFGFDFVGIVRAAIKNIQSRRIVQGGSTLTQQTAKNLFKRQNRSIKAKLKELLFALRLEYHYPKEKIFEFYANQFYVSGNGHGLGVAARYYFDKKPEQLTLLQCAYIAGSVKRPNYYNPFIKKSEEATKKALEHGRTRVNYVLAKMHELGMISEYELGVAKFNDIGFKKGRVGFPLDYVMDMVKDAVSSNEVTQALEKHDISNVSTSGVRIITSVDKKVQDQTLYSLRHDLSRLDVRLRGYERAEVQEELAQLDYSGDAVVRKGAFRIGVIEDIEKETGKPQFVVNLGRRFGNGVIDEAGIARLVEARVKWQKNPWSEADDKDFVSFTKQLQQGDKVWVSIRDQQEDGRLALDLEKFPQVNGGALVLKDGAIKAMAGGVENRFYNRAIYARRTMGSSFKPFVFAAALQLGWNSTDHLMNSRDVFVFQNQPYFPRPDHHSPFAEVSMSWAGVKSENVASVWLLSHLCDKLTGEQFREVAEHVGLAPKIIDGEQEPYSRFRSRIRDRNGIIITEDVLRKAAYHLAQKNVETDFIFAGRDLEYSLLQKMHYGLGFDGFKASIKEELAAGGKKLSSSYRKEMQLRRTILSHSYLDYGGLRAQFREYAERYKTMLAYRNSGFYSGFDALGGADVKSSGGLYYDSFAHKYCFLHDPEESGGMIAVSLASLDATLASLDETQKTAFWNDVYLDGKLSVEAFDLMQQQVERELNILDNQLPYTMDTLEHLRDFRILVGLKYLISLAHQLGVESELLPVLSFPLGSNVVTLLETLRIYEGLSTGTVTLTGSVQGEESNLLCIIDRIESSEGEVLYKPERTKKRLLAPETTLPVGHILENVIKYGTGKYADKNIKLTEAETPGKKERLDALGLSIPVLGKTGTANRYTNASFFGFLPKLSPKKDGLTIEDGYAVGVYVGFDDNEAMRKGATRIAGSAGALPIWCEIVNGIVEQDKYAEQLDAVDLSFYGLSLERPDTGQKNIAVAVDQGGVIDGTARLVGWQDRYSPSILTYGTIKENGSFKPERKFLPFWKVSSTTEKKIQQ